MYALCSQRWLDALTAQVHYKAHGRSFEWSDSAEMQANHNAVCHIQPPSPCSKVAYGLVHTFSIDHIGHCLW